MPFRTLKDITIRVYPNMASVPAGYVPKLLKLTLGSWHGVMHNRALAARRLGKKLDRPVAIAFLSGHPIGWNMVDHKRKIEQFVAPKHRGKGIGSRLLRTTAKVANIPLNRNAVYHWMPSARKVLARALRTHA